MRSKVLMKWLNLIALAIVIAVNALANLIPIGGNTTGQVSAAYPTLFTPTAITFAIWGAIYILMIIFILFQTGYINDRIEGMVMRDDIGAWFILSCAANVCWILSWHFRAIGLSVLFIVCLLICLFQISDLATMHRVSSPMGKVSIAGIHLYLGWICAATIANVCVFLKAIQWDGFGMSDAFWTVIALVIAAALGVALSLAKRTPVATLGIIWAFLGILVRHVSSMGYWGEYPVIIGATVVGIVLMIAAIAVCIRNTRNRNMRRLGDRE